MIIGFLYTIAKEFWPIFIVYPLPQIKTKGAIIKDTECISIILFIQTWLHTTFSDIGCSTSHGTGANRSGPGLHFSTISYLDTIEIMQNVQIAQEFDRRR